MINHFRVIPTVSSNPMTGSIDVSFQPDVDGTVLLEDVMTLIEKAHSEKDRMIVVLDEFQEICEIAPKLDKRMRSIMQEQKHINYVLLGSQESMMTDIFENKKSPFYHFGELMRLGVMQPDTEDPMGVAIDHIVKSHGLDYERLWMKFNRTNRWILQRLASGKPLQSGEYRTSTVYSALKRLQKDGYVVYSDRYEIEDPFFRQWVLEEME